MKETLQIGDQIKFHTRYGRPRTGPYTAQIIAIRDQVAQVCYDAPLTGQANPYDWRVDNVLVHRGGVTETIQARVKPDAPYLNPETKQWQMSQENITTILDYDPNLTEFIPLEWVKKCSTKIGHVLQSQPKATQAA